MTSIIETYFCMLVFHFVHLIFIFFIIGLLSGVFANGPGDWDSISGRVIPKTQKMTLDAA